MTDRWALAAQAAALLAVDPSGLGGAVLRAPAGPARDTWLALLKATMPADRPWRRLPPQIAAARLLGGLDLAATLAAGRPIAERGLLAEVADGVLVVPMAERLGPATAGPLAAVLDSGEVVTERDGLALRTPTRFACILLDEGQGDERAPETLCERVAFRLDLDGIKPEAGETLDVHAARGRFAQVAVDDTVVEALCAAGTAFGVPSLRIATMAVRAAKAAAALAGREAVAPGDAEFAAALVIAPRATTIPAAALDDDEPEAADIPEPPDDEAAQDDRLDPPREDAPDVETVTPQEQTSNDSLADRVVEATRAAIPAGLLAAISLAAGGLRAPSAAGRAGAAHASAKRGRPAGVRRGMPGQGSRLALVDTLRAAAPWQPIRRKASTVATGNRILVRREDFRLARYKQKSETVTIFVVDASGSAALHRLAEVKGAVELILAECYVRRDSVAVIAFRGAGAETILPPTRSLARAKRALAGQAGGGGTPLATAIEAAALLAEAVKRKGQAPLVVFLTDGKANIGRGGQRGRAEAEADALLAARAFRGGGCPSLLLDTAPRPGEAASRLAIALGARYRPLPHADARAMSRVVLDVTAPSPPLSARNI